MRVQYRPDGSGRERVSKTLNPRPSGPFRKVKPTAGDGTGFENRRGESPCEFDPLTFRLDSQADWRRQHFAKVSSESLVGSIPTLSVMNKDMR